MKKLIFALLLVILLGTTHVYSQNYLNIVNYHKIASPNYGIKIKTNIPFEGGNGMPVIKIEGYNYDLSEVININLVFYVWKSKFVRMSATSFGSSTPPIYLSNEDDKITIFMDFREYQQRFTISAFSPAYPNSLPAHFEGWRVIDEPLGGNEQTLVPYKNKFAGDVSIGNNILGGKLDVNGTIRAKEVKIEATGWSDFVFDKNYNLPSLQYVEKYINDNKHLPNIPSEKEVLKEGVNVIEMQTKLLQKIEELTLYVIELEKQNKNLQHQVNQQNNRIEKLESK